MYCEVVYVKYGGLDVHKDFVQACWVDGRNKVVLEERFDTTPSGLGRLTEQARGSRCVIESSTACFQVYDALQEAKVRVRVAHPLKVKAIASAKIKTDKIDARTLAQLERADLIPEAHIPNKLTRELRELVREHVSSTQERTRIKCRVRALLLKHGVAAPRNLFTKTNTAWALTQFQDASLLALQQAFERLQLLKTQREKVDALIEEKAKENKDAVLLKTIPGVGWFTALVLSAEIDGVKRFPDAEHLASYAGLTPSVHQSANVKRSGPISRQGNKLMRWTLVQAAWLAVRESRKCRKLFTRLSRKKGVKKAIIAVARKLLTYSYFMLKNNEVFDENA